VRDWKTIRHAPGKALELYDLKNDLGEEEDVAASNPQVVREMEDTLQTARSPYLDRPDFEAKAMLPNSSPVESGHRSKAKMV